MACTPAYHLKGAFSVHVVRMTPEFHKIVADVEAWLNEDEARGQFQQWYDGKGWVVGFTDANTAFAFKMRFA